MAPRPQRPTPKPTRDGLYKRRRRDGTFYDTWSFRYRDAAGVWRTTNTRCTDRASALLVRSGILMQVQRVLAGVSTADPARVGATVTQAIEAHLAHVAPGSGPAWNAKRAAYLKRAAEDLRWTRLADIDPRAVIAYLDAPKVGPITWNTRRDLLAAFTRWCVRHRYLDRDPLADLPRRAVVKGARRRGLWRAEDALALLEAPPPSRGPWRGQWPRMRMIAAMAMYAAVRMGDLENRREPHRVVRIKHLRLDAANPTIEIPHPKSYRVRLAPVVSPLRAVLEPYLAWYEAWLGRPLHLEDPLVEGVPEPRTLRRHLARLGLPTADAQGRPLDWHGLSTVFYTLARWRGLSRDEARIMGRHADMRVVDDHYTAELDEDLRRVALRYEAGGARLSARSPGVPPCPSVAPEGHGRIGGAG